MNVKESLEKMKNIQNIIIEYIDSDENSEENFQNLQIFFDDHKIKDERYDLMLILSLITQIANNHHRGINFFEKIEKILQFLKNAIQKFFSNTEIFNIFGTNKKILLFLLKEKMFMINSKIASKMTTFEYKNANYPHYFWPEISPFLSEIEKREYEYNIPTDNYEENRQIGQNHDPICELIRKDMITEFISFVNKNNCSLDGGIQSSIYETNVFLQKKKNIKFIEYAAFFGAIQIFKYLQLNKCQLEPSLWLFAIHGNNSEMIHLLEENDVDPPPFDNEKINEIDEENEFDLPIQNKEENPNQQDKNKSYIKCHVEAIKCHHNDLANYFRNYFELSKNEEEIIKEIILKYHNFAFIQDDFINKSSFYDLCRYGYLNYCIFLFKEAQFDVNDQIVINSKSLQNFKKS